MSKIKFTTMMMVKQKRGRERQHRRQRERERERDEARAFHRSLSNVFRVLFGCFRNTVHTGKREREREREDRTRKRGATLSSHPLSLSNDFKNVQRHESRKMETKFTRLLPSIRELGPSRRSRSRPRTRVSVDLPPLVVVVVPLCVFEESVVWSRFVKAPLCSLDDESFL